MFDIRTMPGKRHPTHTTVLAEIAIEKFRESFLMDLRYWSESGYRRQWLGACERFLASERPVLLITSAGGPPTKAKLIGCWVLYHSRGAVKIQNRIGVPGSEKFKTWRGVEDLLEAKHSRFSKEIDEMTGKRGKISTWSTSIASIRGFRDRLLAKRG